MTKTLIALLGASLVIAADQYSKMLMVAVFTNMPYQTIEVLPFFNLVMVRNSGISFGMFSNLANGQIILSSLAIVITLFLAVWMLNEKHLYTKIAIGFIIGGAIGNVLDRLQYGFVIDFLDFYINRYHWPAFNVADAFVFIGVVMIIVEGFFIKRSDQNG